MPTTSDVPSPPIDRHDLLELLDAVIRGGRRVTLLVRHPSPGTVDICVPIELAPPHAPTALVVMDIDRDRSTARTLHLDDVEGVASIDGSATR